MHTLTLILAVVAYLAAAALFGRLTAIAFRGRPEPWWVCLPMLVFAPAGLVLLVLLGLVMTPFWWLYPERHAHIFDGEGTEEDKRVLAEYRATMSRKPFRRRLAERLRLAPNTDPPYPWPDYPWPSEDAP